MAEGGGLNGSLEGGSRDPPEQPQPGSSRLNLGSFGSARLSDWRRANLPSSLHLRGDLHQVVRGLRPFVEQTLLRHTRNGRDAVSHTHHHHHHLHHNHGPLSPEPQPPTADLPENQFVIDVDGVPNGNDHNNAGGVGVGVQAGEGGAGAAAGGDGGAQNNNNNTLAERTGNAADILRQNPEIRAVLNVFEKYVTFVLILLAKGIYDHRTGLLVFAGLAVTFSHANSAVKREVGKQSKRQLGSLLIVAVNLLACMLFIYFIFEEEKLYLSLIFFPPNLENMSVWDLLWVVGITDYVLKLITILLKMVIVAIPSQVLLPFPKRGKYYLFIEESSQLYRSLCPIHPWLYYLFEAYEGASRVVGVLLVAAYMMAKGSDLIQRVRAWRAAAFKLLQNVQYGFSPSLEQVSAVGNQCPICHDSFATPTMLHCKHIFCEECVATWFDRERTCPMCRAQVVDDPVWRDGATTHFIQLF